VTDELIVGIKEQGRSPNAQ